MRGARQAGRDRGNGVHQPPGPERWLLEPEKQEGGERNGVTRVMRPKHEDPWGGFHSKSNEKQKLKTGLHSALILASVANNGDV